MYGWLPCCLVLGLAVWWDFKTHRIPNRLIGLGMGLAGMFALLPTGIGLLNAVLGGSLGLALFLPLYLLRILGAGDVKLLATVGAFVGYGAVLQVALYSGLVGGVLAILIALRHGQLQPMLLNLYRGAVGLFIQINHGGSAAPWVMVTRSYPLPYALAIALGTLVYAFLHVFL